MNHLPIGFPTRTEPAGADTVIVDTEDCYVVTPSSTEAGMASNIVVEFRGPLGWSVTRNGHELNHNHEWVRVSNVCENPGDFRWARPAAIEVAAHMMSTGPK